MARAFIHHALTNESGGVHMKNEMNDCRGKIIELVNSIEDEFVLRRIYLMLITMIGVDH